MSSLLQPNVGHSLTTFKRIMKILHPAKCNDIPVKKYEYNSFLP